MIFRIICRKCEGKGRLSANTTRQDSVSTETNVTITMCMKYVKKLTLVAEYVIKDTQKNAKSLETTLGVNTVSNVPTHIQK